MGEVARIDSLGRVAREEVLVELEARGLLQLGYADVLGGTRKDGGLVDDDIAGLQHGAHGAAGSNEGGEIGTLGVVHRRRYGDDVEVAGT